MQLKCVQGVEMARPTAGARAALASGALGARIVRLAQAAAAIHAGAAVRRGLAETGGREGKA